MHQTPEVAPSKWSVSIPTGLTSDTEPSVILQFDSAKYIVNVGENTTRAFLQNKHGWRKMKGVFFTDVRTQRSSGAPGFFMSLADGGINHLDVAGPSGLLHYLASMRTFTYRDSMAMNPIEIDHNALSMHNTDPRPIFQDENIRVWALTISPDKTGEYIVRAQSSAQATFSLNVMSESASLKRKREPSPMSPRPSKTPAVSPTPELSSGMSSKPSLDEQFLFREFYPTSLEGDDAQKWRRFLVKHMFECLDPLDVSSASDQNVKIRSQGARADKRTGQRQRQTKVDITSDMLDVDAPLSTFGSAAIQRADRRARTPLPPGSWRRLPVPTRSHGPRISDDSNPTLAYVIVGPRMRGKFDAKKADQLGLKSGPQRGVLAKGQPVTVQIDDGNGNMVERVIRPEDCLGPSEKPSTVIVLDVPTPAFIPSLVASFTESRFFKEFRYKSGSEHHSTKLVVHKCGDGVIEDERYVAFMNGFSSETQHLVSSPSLSADPLTFTMAGFVHLKLNALDSEMFPIPKFRTQSEAKLEMIPNLPAKTSVLRPNMIAEVRPSKPPVNNKAVTDLDLFHPAVSSSSLGSLLGPLAPRFAEIRRRVVGQVDRISTLRPGDDITIVPLGTSSAVPTRYRNVSSTLIMIPRWGNILLDVGEGTWGQLMRSFGSDSSQPGSAWDVLKHLKCIFVSHVHADHHMGLAKLLARRQRLDLASKDSLYLIGNRPIHRYIREYADLEDLGFDETDGRGIISISSEAIEFTQSMNSSSAGSYRAAGPEPWMNAANSQKLAHDLCRTLGLHSFQTVPVNHSCKCWGAVIKHTEGWSIVYSGDTTPSSELVTAGRNATVLIHEATMGDDNVEEARIKRHSTAAQAIEIGKQMNATNVLLTHFSARYPKMPPSLASNPDGGPGRPAIALAFDNARIRVGDMWKLNQYLPAIEQSYADLEDDDEGLPAYDA